MTLVNIRPFPYIQLILKYILAILRHKVSAINHAMYNSDEFIPDCCNMI